MLKNICFKCEPIKQMLISFEIVVNQIRISVQREIVSLRPLNCIIEWKANSIFGMKFNNYKVFFKKNKKYKPVKILATSSYFLKKSNFKISTLYYSMRGNPCFKIFLPAKSMEFCINEITVSSN